MAEQGLGGLELWREDRMKGWKTGWERGLLGQQVFPDAPFNQCSNFMYKSATISTSGPNIYRLMSAGVTGLNMIQVSLHLSFLSSPSDAQQSLPPLRIQTNCTGQTD